MTFEVDQVTRAIQDGAPYCEWYPGDYVLAAIRVIEALREAGWKRPDEMCPTCRGEEKLDA